MCSYQAAMNRGGVFVKIKFVTEKVIIVFVGLFLSGALACSNVTSTVTSIIPGLPNETATKVKVGERLALKVPPQVAIMLFQDVATENGWAVRRVGDQRNINGEITGKFFRVETIQFVGGRRTMTGVFFIEDDDEEASYVMMGKPGTEVMYGIPLALVRPMQSAVAEWRGDDSQEVFEDEGAAAQFDATALEEALAEGSEDFDPGQEPEVYSLDFEGAETGEVALPENADGLFSDVEDREESTSEQAWDDSELGTDDEQVLDDFELSIDEEQILEDLDLSPGD